ncbi:DUF2851 family protein [Sphingobacterium sp. N143]|uniref:DUF2851 family protein n=1 Tax=Sphingobacterium sp. N143 TaxID=2746727 RepID=UPI002574F183|nr:DUF2851 family protein [Sphingobacterium sp. N143]MDM1292884.1 DUF2851 family protein [Sphingobacterium sp. N143]
MMVTENLMQFIWKLRLFNTIALESTEGVPLSVVNVGQHNLNAGPDFKMARIILGNEEWAGHIEMHVRASDWNRHHHQYDVSYNNVVLHVVWINDQVIYRKDGTVIPTLELSAYVDQDLLMKYANMMTRAYWIPCQAQLDSVDTFKRSMWLDALSYERLEMKILDVFSILAKADNDWERVFWVWMCRGMGLSVNVDMFQELGEKLPFQVLQKYRFDPFKIEALFFGISGLLPRDHPDEYTRQLIDEFDYQKAIHDLVVINGNWKKLRMRPYNFPELRVAQLAALFSGKSLSLSKILDVEGIEEARSLFELNTLNDYWRDHFSFTGPTRTKHAGKIGKGTIDVLIINVIVTFLFAYGKYYGIEKYMDKAIRFLELLPVERNVIIEKFKEYGWPVQNASQSQSLLQLKKWYCDKKQCLNCRIGAVILRNG